MKCFNDLGHLSVNLKARRRLGEENGTVLWGREFPPLLPKRGTEFPQPYPQPEACFIALIFLTKFCQSKRLGRF
jgi:hypothetical protein